MIRILVQLIAGAALAAAVPGPAHGHAASARSHVRSPSAAATAELDAVARRYVRLTLEAGTHEDGYVDAYIGPAAAQAAARARPRSVDALRAAAAALIARIDTRVLPRLADPLLRRRAAALRATLVAAQTRLAMIGGRHLAFADEAEGLFAIRPALRPLAEFDPIIADLDRLVPGTGPLAARVDAYNDRFVVPAARLRAVMDAAIAECRRRTAEHIALPAGESFTLEFVTGKPWSGYNYYQGNLHSLIQVNTDLPVRIARAVDLGCHEGYPGHHLLNLIAETRMVRRRHWAEYTVSPLYAPTSLLSEGSANYGIDLAFPGDERLAFERDVLFPIAGFDRALAADYWRVQTALARLAGSRMTIAQMYLDHAIPRDRALELTQHYGLTSAPRAEQSLAFVDHYRSYVINYGLGKDLVGRAIEAGGADRATRWRRMERLLSEPTLPADLESQ